MPKIVDHRERRARIADAALDIVAESGVGAVTLRDVAIRSGWSTGVIHHYVGGRGALLQLAFRRASRLSSDRQDDQSARPGLSAIDRLEAVLKATLPLDKASLALTRIYVFFYAEATAEHELGVDLDHYIESWNKKVELLVSEALIECGLPTKNSRSIADHLVALTDGIAIHTVIGSGTDESGPKNSNPNVRQWIDLSFQLA